MNPSHQEAPKQALRFLDFLCLIRKLHLLGSPRQSHWNRRVLWKVFVIPTQNYFLTVRNLREENRSLASSALRISSPRLAFLRFKILTDLSGNTKSSKFLQILWWFLTWPHNSLQAQNRMITREYNTICAFLPALAWISILTATMRSSDTFHIICSLLLEAINFPSFRSSITERLWSTVLRLTSYVCFILNRLGVEKIVDTSQSCSAPVKDQKLVVFAVSKAHHL